MITPHESVSWVVYPAMTDAERVVAAQAFHAAIANRRTCREIGDARVPRQVIEAAILAAGTAPSGDAHTQPDALSQPHLRPPGA